MCCECFLFLNEFLHLLNEVVLNLCYIENLIYCSTLSERLVHDEMSVA